MATANGARAMGFPASGALAPGRAADIVLFDFDRPHLYPRHSLVANLVHAARGSDVTHVIVDGRLIYRSGELLTLDEEKIKAEAERRARRMVGQSLRIVREYKG
jgi:5-methylthioadenosine/S-adenosylhomocysteine deaminase